MSVRINLEIGHEASIRTKRTQEGFTHDWEVYVKGSDNAPIQYYVEKVIFFLHETFPKPKRVLKEPPYSVKESGYAGFTLPIEVHLRNKDEPKKISFIYEINLQLTGPAVVKVQKEKYVFNSLGEEFKSKLLKGGGIVVNSLSYQEGNRENRLSEEKSQQLVSKPRLGGSDFTFKKHKLKPEETRTSNSFQDLFGTPITKTSKVSVEPKIIPKDKGSVISKPSSAEKEKFKNKHSPHKDKERNKDKDVERKSKEEKKREEKKEHSKDREERVKEKKEKREKSPKGRSPTPSKRSLSPLAKGKDKEDRKAEIAKVKKSDDKDKAKSEKKAKKERRDKEKERKENKHKDRENLKVPDLKEGKSSSREKEPVREKEPSPMPQKIEKKEKYFKDREMIKETKESDNSDKNGKLKSDDKPKHKHKKKDKDRKDKSSDREKSHKVDKKNIDKTFVNSSLKYADSKDSQRENEKSNLFSSPKNSLLIDKSSEKLKKPLNTLIASFSDSDSSSSSVSSHDEPMNEVTKPEPKKELFDSPPAPIKPEPQITPIENQSTRIEEKAETTKMKSKRDKTKKNKDKKGDRDTEKRKKRKIESALENEPPEKLSRDESSHSKDSDNDTGFVHDVEIEDDYDEYMDLLRDLQNKIYALRDSDEIQQVVELIAETGRFEISQRTFDFDLCLLERSTITALENFFNSSS